jgi:AraC family transcriptional regulator
VNKHQQCVLPNPPLISHELKDLNGFSLEHHRQPAWEIPEHSVSNHKIVIHLASVTIEQEIDRQLRLIKVYPGDICILPANTLHKCRWIDSTEFLTISVESKLINNIANRLNTAENIEILPIFAQKEPLIQQIGLSLLAELQSQESLDSFYVNSLVDILIMRLLKGYGRKIPKNFELVEGLNAFKLKQALDYINDNLDRELRLADIALSLRMSPFYFARSFKQSMGIPPYQYLTQRRIDRAKLLLSNSSLSILEIVQSIGFRTQSHFTRVFREYTGTTPKQYRQELGNRL